MANAHDWIIGLTIYFVGIFIFMSIIGIGVATSQLQISPVGNYMTRTELASGKPTNPVNATGFISLATSFSMKKFFQFIFSFFLFDIGGLGLTGILASYFWIIRVLVVYMPLLALVLAIFYSSPVSSGGG